MKRHLLFALILTAFGPAFGPSYAADTAPVVPNRFAATIVPAEKFEVGAMLVEKHGKRGRPLILIPGLASGSWVWQETVRQFAGEHVVYVVTLPGFDGRPAVAGKVMEAARLALVQLIESRKLDKPVLIGHSLGGTLSYALAAQLGTRIGGVVAIDGLPVFPGSEQMAQAQREELAQNLKQRAMPANQAVFAAQQQAYMRGQGVSDMARADELAKLTARSDPAAFVEYMSETFSMDLRGDLPRISAPVLVMAPYFDEDDTQNQMTKAAKTEYYTSLLAGLPKVEVVAVPKARHFAMFDQPQFVNETIARFIKSL